MSGTTHITGSRAAAQPVARPHRIVVLVRDGVLAMELGTVHRVFGQAVDVNGQPLYRLTTSAVTPGPIRTDGDFTIGVQAGLEALATAETVIIPAAESDKAVMWCSQTDELVAAVGRIQPFVRIATICTGVFIVAATGRLDGRRATTHWTVGERFAEMFPNVHAEAGLLYTEDQGILTSAGVASGVDLCLHMIRSDHGASVANDVARLAVAPPHRAAETRQYLTAPVPESDGSSTARARALVMANLHRPLTLGELAAEEHTSTRTLTRRFRDEVGTTPIRWIARLRVDLAREMLERTDLSIDAIADRCGFGTVTSLRLHLRDALGVTPSTYRKGFRP